MKIAIIGFGEAGEMFGRGLAQKVDVFAYDVAVTPEMRNRAELANVALSEDLKSVLDNAGLVLSLVTADQAQCAATHVSEYIQAEQIFLEMNSIAPDTKRANAEVLPGLVDVAIMAPVYPKQMDVPLLLAHPQAEQIASKLHSLGLNVKAVGADIGRAAAIKMCRSVVIKGMEALTLESILTARHYGVEPEVKASLHASFPEMGWTGELVDYWFERVGKHGKRRAAEMREVAKTVQDAGVPSNMSAETARTQDIYAD